MTQMDSGTQERIARQVREERKRRKLSQKELAAMVGVSTNTVGNMERGASFPQHAHLAAICGVLGISLDDDPADDEVAEPAIHDGGWSPDVRVALEVIGLYLETFNPGDREERIATIVRAIMARRL